jgi:DNA-binding NtrC family response regulator
MRLKYRDGKLNLDIEAITKRMQQIDPANVTWPALKEVEEYYFLRAIIGSDGNQSACARLLQETRYAVRYKMQKFDVPKYVVPHVAPQIDCGC